MEAGQLRVTVWLPLIIRMLVTALLVPPPVTLMVGPKVPAADGVPKISPVTELMDNPVGKPAALQL